MVTVLLVESDQRVQNILVDGLKTEVGAEVEIASNLDAALEVLEKRAFRLIVCRNIIDEIEVGKSILNWLYDRNDNSAFVGLGDIDFAGRKITCLKDRFRIEELYRAAIKGLGLTKEELEVAKLPDYVPMPVKHFYLMKNTCCDIFIRIAKKNAEDQYVKRIKAGDSFDKEVIQKYEAKGVDEFYIQKDFRNQFMDLLLSQSLSEIDASQPVEELVEKMGDSFEIGHDMLKNLGVTEHSIKMAEGTIKAMNDMVQSDPQLGSLLKNVLANKGSYTYKHGLLISCLAAGVVPRMDWGQNEQLQLNIEKLVFVSFFHDIALDDDKLATIRNKVELYQADLKPDLKELVLNHANKASTLVQSFPKTPSGVDVIIRQHHGASNGVGFAESWSNSISALATVFIVLEKFAHRVLHFQKGVDSMKLIFEEMYVEFETPSYRRVVDALKTSLTASF